MENALKALIVAVSAIAFAMALSCLIYINREFEQAYEAAVEVYQNEKIIYEGGM